MIIWLIFFLFLQTKPSFCRLFAGPSWTFLPKHWLSEYTRCGGGGWMGHDQVMMEISDTTSRRTWQNIIELLCLIYTSIHDSCHRCLLKIILSVLGRSFPQLNLNDIGRNCLLGNREKIAKFLMRTFTYRSTVPSSMGGCMKLSLHP